MITDTEPTHAFHSTAQHTHLHPSCSPSGIMVEVLTSYSSVSPEGWGLPFLHSPLSKVWAQGNLTLSEAPFLDPGDAQAWEQPHLQRVA